MYHYYHVLEKYVCMSLRSSKGETVQRTWFGASDIRIETSWSARECTYYVICNPFSGLENLGMEFYVSNPSHRLPTVTTVKVPTGIDWKAVVGHSMSK